MFPGHVKASEGSDSIDPLGDTITQMDRRSRAPKVIFTESEDSLSNERGPAPKIEVIDENTGV